MTQLQSILTSPALWVVLGALLLPVTWPLLLLLLPVGGILLLSVSNRKTADGELKAAAIEPSKADADLTSSAVHPVGNGANGVAEPQAPVAATSPRKEASVAPKPAPALPAGDSEQSEKISTAPVPGAAGGAAILARLRAQREAKAASKPAGSKEVVVLYASQTGTAQEIAKGIQAEAESQGLKAKVASMNEFGFENLTPEKAPIVIMVASSTGDGDPPDNAAKFYMAVRRKSHANSMLQGILFTSMGLGDSNYTRFCHVPRTLVTRFRDLGAKEFYKVGEADEVDGIEDIVDTWLEGLWPAVKQAAQGAGEGAAGGASASTDASELKGVPALPRCRIRLVWEDSGSEAVRHHVRRIRGAVPQAEHPTKEELAHRDPSGMYSAEAPLWAAVSDARYLTTEESKDRQVLHLELDIAGSSMQYHPGDSIGVLPENADVLVDGIVKRLGLDKDAVFDVEAADEADGGTLLPHLKCPCTVRSALKRGCDLTSVPRKSLLRLLAEHCSDSKEKFRLTLLCSKDGREAYSKEILEGKPTLLDLLNEFPSCKPPLDALLDALPALPARMYSVACSPLELANKVQVAFTVVHFDSKYGKRDGVATTWLERLCEPVTSGKRTASAASIQVPIFLRRGGDFKPPETLDAPVIMIGPGTGVTPFRGFLQHRRAQLAKSQNPQTAGDCWLFFGCRRADQDYLYKDDFNALQKDGTLKKLVVAFSRAQAHKVYVQHLMKEHSKELFDLIVNQEAYVFVCGDGLAMAKDVQACLTEIVQQEAGISQAEAAEVLSEMAKQERYVRDIWS